MTDVAAAVRRGLRAPSAGELIGVGMLALAGAGYGAASTLAKLAYRHGAPVESVLVARFALGAAAVWALLLGRRVPVRIRALAGRGVVVTGVCYAASTGLFIASLRHVAAPTASLLSYAYPAIVMLLMIVWGGERFRPRLGGVLALALAGVALVAQAPLRSVGALGAALALGSALTFAFYIVASGSIVETMPPLALSALVLAVALGAFLVAGAATGRLGAVRSAGAAWAVAAGLVGGLITPCYQSAVARLGPTRTAVGGTFAPLATAALAAAVLGERLGGLQLLGGALVLASLACLPLLGTGGARGGAGAGP